MSERMPLQATTYGAKIKIARLLRGMSQQDLADRSGVSIHSIGSLEKRQSNMVDPDNLEQLATALAVPAIYFISKNPKDYVVSRYSSLSEEQRPSLLQKPLHERLAWLVNELVALWPGVVSLDTLAAQMPLQSAEDLRHAVHGNFSLSADQMQALMAATGAPRELFVGVPAELPADISPEKFRLYMNVIQLADSAGIDPGRLAALVAAQMMANQTQNPAGR